MEVPGGPHYPLLIIKGEHRGNAALTKRFNWFESLLALCPQGLTETITMFWFTGVLVCHPVLPTG